MAKVKKTIDASIFFTIKPSYFFPRIELSVRSKTSLTLPRLKSWDSW